MKSEFRQVEVFITSDGNEYLDEDSAKTHEHFIRAKDAFHDMVDCDIDNTKIAVEVMRPYLEYIMNELDNEDLY